MGEPDCRDFYGFLPCSDTQLGALFLVAVYGFLVYTSTDLLSHGSQWLMSWLEGFCPVALPGLCFPNMEQAVPTAVILVAALANGPTSTQVLAGAGCWVGMVASVAFLWGATVLCGCYTPQQAQDASKWSWSSISGLLSGVVAPDNTGSAKDVALLVLTGSLLFLSVQVLAFFHVKHLHVALWFIGMLCILALPVYVVHQVLSPELQRRRQVSRRHRHLRYNVVRSVAYYANRYGGILTPEGVLNVDAITRIFQRFDRDKDGVLDRQEVLGLLQGMDFMQSHRTMSNSNSCSDLVRQHSLGQAALPPSPSTGLGDLAGRESLSQQSDGLSPSVAYPQVQLQLQPPPLDGVLDYLMAECAPEGRGHIPLESFQAVLKAWFEEKQRRFVTDFPEHTVPKAVKKAGGTTPLWWLLVSKAPDTYMAPVPVGQQQQQQQQQTSDLSDPLLADQDPEDPSELLLGQASEVASGSTSSRAVGEKAAEQRRCLAAVASALRLLAGLALCGAFAWPLVGSVTDLAAAVHWPPFLAAALLVPLPLVARQAVAGIAHVATKSGSAPTLMRQACVNLGLHCSLGMGLLMVLLAASHVPWSISHEMAPAVLLTAGFGAYLYRQALQLQQQVQPVQLSWVAGLMALAACPLLLATPLLLRTML